MMNPTRILVALRLSRGHGAAFERALALAKASGAELYLLHAVPANQRFSYRAAERLQRSAERRERAEAAGVRAVSVEQHGDPAEIIVLHADARPVDLIVMGSERRTGWARLRERSVAERVVRRTRRPTLVVGHDDTSDQAIFENVLVGVDASPASTPLIETALQLLRGHRRQLTVVHAVNGLEAADAALSRAWWTANEYRQHLLRHARRELRDVMPSGVNRDVIVQTHVAPGRPDETIVEYAAAVNADLIVVGRRTRFMHFGSTAVRVLRRTDRALLIVPPAASEHTVGAGPFGAERAA
jgi:nucleotide-binding universal stress UspA family protein